MASDTDAIFLKGDNFCDSVFACLSNKTISFKGSSIYKGRICSKSSTFFILVVEQSFFLLELTPIATGGKNEKDRVASSGGKPFSARITGKPLKGS